MSEVFAPQLNRALFCAFLFTLAGCGAAGNPSSPIVPSPTPVAAALTLSLTGVAIAGDLGPAHTSIPLGVKDAGGKPLSGAFSSVVTVSVTSGASHALLSTDGGAIKSSSISVRSSAEAASLSVYYDGSGGPGFVATVTASAPHSTSASAAVSTITTSASVVFGNAPSYAPGNVLFSAPSQQLKITLNEPNFSGTYSVAANTCGGIAAVVLSGDAVSATSQAFGNCSFTLTDGNATYRVAVASNVTQSPATVPPPSGTVTEIADPTTNFTASAIDAGPDGNVWYVGTAAGRGVLGRITPAGALRDFDLGAGVNPVALAAGSDGKLWVADAASNLVFRFSTSGTPAGSPISAGSGPVAMTLGADGAIWIADATSGRLTCIASSGAQASYGIPNAVSLAGIAAGSDGALWVTDAVAPFVARVSAGCATPSAGVVNAYPIPASSGSGGIANGADGALWFTQLFPGPQGSVGRIATSGAYSAYAESNTVPAGAVALGADRNIWFAACSCGIGRMTAGGAFGAVATGVSGTPKAVTAAGDGGMWYVTQAGSTVRIGRVQP